MAQDSQVSGVDKTAFIEVGAATEVGADTVRILPVLGEEGEVGKIDVAACIEVGTGAGGVASYAIIFQPVAGQDGKVGGGDKTGPVEVGCAAPVRPEAIRVQPVLGENGEVEESYSAVSVHIGPFAVSLCIGTVRRQPELSEDGKVRGGNRTCFIKVSAGAPAVGETIRGKPVFGKDGEVGEVYTAAAVQVSSARVIAEEGRVSFYVIENGCVCRHRRSLRPQRYVVEAYIAAVGLPR